MSKIYKLAGDLQAQANWNNPVLARRTATFVFCSIVLNLVAWGVNAGFLLFNLLATDMVWPIAVTIFCTIWLAIWTWTRFIMAPMGRRLALEQHDEVLKVISNICDQAGQKKT